MISRVKQLFRYFFANFDTESEREVESFLSEEKFKIFKKMGAYDKFHSFLIYKAVKSDELLSQDKNYLKLALLHDCGKGNTGILRRIKKVILGDSLLSKHPEFAYEKLKNIDLKLAQLCREHHNKVVDEKMKRFQKIDDRW